MTDDLKKYQQRCLQELGQYLQLTSEVGAASAFGAKRRPTDAYETVPGWENLPKSPYVCVRVPTGGGKTLLAAHAVGSVCQNLTHMDRCVVLWLAPSKAIVSQTYQLLRSRASRPRQALNAAFGGHVEVLTVDDALRVSPATLAGATTIIVSSGQAWKREGEDMLRVFKEDNADMAAHLQNVPEAEATRLEKFAWGGLVPSLANVLRLHRPVVIIDEGHRFRTPLTFQTLRKFDPRAVVEFTATPYEKKKDVVRCNVIVEATAADLKLEHMIKAPIELSNSDKWEEAVRLAIAKRKELARAAQENEKATGEYIRPIVLFKAQDASVTKDTITPDKLRAHLIASENIPPHEIAVYTGKEKDLPDDVQSPVCPVNYVITVDALSEGWDCPFAYVLCVIANLSSGTAVEQILGRVLRLPRVRAKPVHELNHAYCFTSSTDFSTATTMLKEAIVKGGFGRDEAEAMIKQAIRSETQASQEPSLFEPKTVELVIPCTFTSDQRQELEAVLPGSVSFQPEAGGASTKIVYSGPIIEPQTMKRVAAVMNSPAEPNAAKRLERAVAGKDSSPAAAGTLFSITGLALRDEHADNGLALWDGQHRETPWTLEGYTPIDELERFNPAPDGVDVTTLDIEADGTWSPLYRGRLAATAAWADQSGPRTIEQLSAWLDRHVVDTRVTQVDKRPFIDRCLLYMMQRRKATVESLAPVRWKLAERLTNAINFYRAKAEEAQFQHLLHGGAELPQKPPPSIVFSFERVHSEYPFMRTLTPKTKFNHHYYSEVGTMDKPELLLAQHIDTHPNVATWIRNLDRADGAFFLPGLDGRFYPDFVAKLRDGRYAAIEYKGPQFEESERERMKFLVGKLWEGRSGGKYVFVWVTGDHFWDQLTVLNAK